MTCKKHTAKLRDFLRANGLRATPQRLALLDLLEHNRRPLSIREILPITRYPTDEVTLYRNIKSLTEIGAVKPVRLDDEQTYYELNHGHHHHLVCIICKKVKEVPACDIKIGNKKTLKSAGFASITDHALELFGVCLACRGV